MFACVLCARYAHPQLFSLERCRACARRRFPLLLVFGPPGLLRSSELTLEVAGDRSRPLTGVSSPIAAVSADVLLVVGCVSPVGVSLLLTVCRLHFVSRRWCLIFLVRPSRVLRSIVGSTPVWCCVAPSLRACFCRPSRVLRSIFGCAPVWCCIVSALRACFG